MSSLIESISAITLATHDMARAVAFYEGLGFVIAHGGATSDFTTFAVGDRSLNLIHADGDTRWAWWGRVIIYVTDVDAMHRHVIDAGLHPQAPPSDAPWGERYFHITDPDGHELSFAKPLE